MDGSIIGLRRFSGLSWGLDSLTPYFTRSSSFLAYCETRSMSLWQLIGSVGLANAILAACPHPKRRDVFSEQSDSGSGYSYGAVLGTSPMLRGHDSSTTGELGQGSRPLYRRVHLWLSRT